MRIITWNCRQGGLKEKFEKYLAPLKPDVLIVQEADDTDLEGQTNRVWLDPNGRGHCGLGVYTFNEYSLQKKNTAINSWGLYLPATIHRNGKPAFNVVGFWTKPKQRGGNDYMNGFIKAIDKYSAFIRSKPTILAGDLNALGGLSWYGNILTQTEELGLVSAYHEFTKVRIGDEKYEKESTYYHHFKHPMSKGGLPHQLDHVFIPLTWKRRLSGIRIGTGRMDTARKNGHPARSDHRPVIVDIDLDIDLSRGGYF